MTNDISTLKSFYRALKRHNENLIKVIYGTMEGKTSLSFDDIETVKNLLIYGTTGSGKTMFLNVFIEGTSYINTEKDVRLVLVDSKKAGFCKYNDNKLLLCPIINDRNEFINIINELLIECDKRKENNIKAHRIILVVDEYADIASEETNNALAKILEVGYKYGIHVLLSTQRITSAIASIDFFKKFNIVICQKNYDEKETKELIGEYHELNGRGDSIMLRNGRLFRFIGFGI